MNAYFNIRILLVFIYDRFTQLFTFQNWRGKYEHNALGVFMELISTIILTGVQNQFKTQYMCQTNEDQTHTFISNEADPGKHFLGCSYLSLHDNQTHVFTQPLAQRRIARLPSKGGLFQLYFSAAKRVCLNIIWEQETGKKWRKKQDEFRSSANSCFLPWEQQWGSTGWPWCYVTIVLSMEWRTGVTYKPGTL